MSCQQCGNTANDQYLRCENCGERLFQNEAVRDLWNKYANNTIVGALLELIYRAFNGPKGIENEEAWRRIYPAIYANIETYLQNYPCKRMTWLLYKHDMANEDIIHEVFKSKIIPFIKKLKKNNRIFEPKSLESFIAFINKCTINRVIEIFRYLQPKTKDIEGLCKQIIKSNLYDHCLKQSIKIFDDYQAYHKILTQRFIRVERQKKKLFRRKEYHLILRLSIYMRLTPQKIVNHIDINSFKKKYQMEDAPLKKVKRKIYDLKEEALIELFLIVVCCKKSYGFEDFRDYFLDKLAPYKLSLEERKEKEISEDEYSEEDADHQHNSIV